MEDLHYHLNDRDEILACNEEWSVFARANQGDDLDGSKVIGQSLWSLIRDPATQHIYRILHGRIRATGIPVRLRIRCDAPDRRRLLQVSILAAPDRGLYYRIRTLKEEPRPPVALLDPGQPRSDGFIAMCSWCKRMETPGGDWTEVEDAIRSLDLLGQLLPPQITHGICQECSTVVHEGLDRMTATPGLSPDPLALGQL